MNYLGHAFLAGVDSGELAGNFTGDFYKGSRFDGLPDSFVRGIRIHRFIDMTTDNHDFVRALKLHAAPIVGRYSGVVADLWIDHLMCNCFAKLSDLSLSVYCQGIFDKLRSYNQYFPVGCSQMLQHMEREAWLESYANIQGVASALAGITHRRKVPVPLNQAVYAMPSVKELENELIIFLKEMNQAVESFRLSLNL